jgi:RNA polymerase sigma-70 factor (ECF subfamily)
MDEASLWPEIESLYRAKFGQFERVARAITSDRDLALEAVQEGFADALRRCDQWAGSGPLEGWVWRCVVNRARKARRRPAPELRADEPSTDGNHTHAELVARLAVLPERQRLVVFLRYFADLEYREIAEALEIETGTVSATLHAAHANLKTGQREALA